MQAPKYAETQLYGLLYTSSESDDMSSVPSSRREASQLVGGFIAPGAREAIQVFLLVNSSSTISCLDCTLQTIV